VALSFNSDVIPRMGHFLSVVSSFRDGIVVLGTSSALPAVSVDMMECWKLTGHDKDESMWAMRSPWGWTPAQTA